MNDELDTLDFEKGYLADVLKITGDRVATLESYIDAGDPEGNAVVFDPMEHMAGVAMVAAQRYISSVCNWFSVPKKRAFLLGPRRKGVAVATIVGAVANYWKHIEDGEDAVYPSTRDVLADVGVAFDSGYCVSNAIHKCGYNHLSELLDDLVEWRDAVIQEAQKKNA